jgi:auxin responsive GH3 family protein
MDDHNLDYKGSGALEELEMLTVNAKEAQELILTKILERNQATEYLSKFMNGSTNISAFKRHVPVVTYDKVHPYILRIATGEESSILCGEYILELLRRCASHFNAFISSHLFPVYGRDSSNQHILVGNLAGPTCTCL